MAEVATLARQVRQHWLAQGLHVWPVAPEDLAALDQSLPVPTPAEYEVFLRVAGVAADEDATGIRFWSPRELRPTSDVLADAGYRSDAVHPSVIIADSFQESWWYALWLAGPFAGHVSLVLGDDGASDPQPPIGTLAVFLRAYLEEDERLYPPDVAANE